MKAWHFTKDTLRDGTSVPEPGFKLVFSGEPVLCQQGLHASIRVIDALAYAPGCIVHRVNVGGYLIQSTDKIVATERTILWSLNAEDVLRRFARLCALDVVHLWDAPEAVLKYLKTGDSDFRSAAESAADYAAWSAAWSAARSAARSAAESAAESAARSAAWFAARSAAESAAESAADYAARSAAESAAESAADYAAWSAQNDRLSRMLIEANRNQ